MFGWLRRKDSAEVVALKESNTALLDALRAATAVATTSNEVMKSFMDGFKVSAPPTVRVSTDYDEFKREQQMIAGEVEKGNLPSPDFSWVLTGESEPPGIYGDN